MSYCRWDNNTIKQSQATNLPQPPWYFLWRVSSLINILCISSLSGSIRRRILQIRQLIFIILIICQLEHPILIRSRILLILKYAKHNIIAHAQLGNHNPRRQELHPPLLPLHHWILFIPFVLRRPLGHVLHPVVYHVCIVFYAPLIENYEFVPGDWTFEGGEFVAPFGIVF
jgi:hypothetical protein